MAFQFPGRLTEFKSKLPGSKKLLLLSLLLIALANSFAIGFDIAAPFLAVSVFFAVATDFLLKFHLTGKKVFSESAAITGLFIGLVLSPNFPPWFTLSSTQPFPFPAFAAIAAIVLKHFVRFNFLTIFNPAASGLFLTLLLFPGAFDAWWANGIPALTIALGVLACWKAERLYALLSYAASFFFLYLVFILSASPLSLIPAFGTAFSFLPLFLGFFMLVDPLTSPPKSKPQVAYGFLAALFSIVLLALNFNLFLYGGLLLANASRFELTKRLK